MANIEVEKVNNNDALLADAVNNKIDCDELTDLQLAIKEYGAAVDNISDLANVPARREGLAVVVNNDIDVNGNSIIWLYNGASWNRTPFFVLPSDVITASRLSKVLGNRNDVAPSEEAVSNVVGIEANKSNYSIRFADYDSILIEENYTISGDERKAIKITIKAPNTFYINIKDKAEQRIEFSNDTEYIIPYNCYQYYQISTNTIVGTAENVMPGKFSSGKTCGRTVFNCEKQTGF